MDLHYVIFRNFSLFSFMLNSKFLNLLKNIIVWWNYEIIQASVYLFTVQSHTHVNLTFLSNLHSSNSCFLKLSYQPWKSSGPSIAGSFLYQEWSLCGHFCGFLLNHTVIRAFDLHQILFCVACRYCLIFLSYICFFLTLLVASHPVQSEP